jgi:hypothetical protein
MTTSRKTDQSKPARPRRSGAVKEGPQLQPAATGGNRGSPAAPVMQQFVKTRTETSGGS